MRKDMLPDMMEIVRHNQHHRNNDLKLYDEGPVLICRTALSSMRVEKGEPQGEVHFAGLKPQKITPAQFKSLDERSYVDIEVIIAELN